MLIRVPRMFTEAEAKRVLGTLPDDFEKTSNEFWAYVNEKLANYVGRVQRVYRDGICLAGKQTLDQLEKVDRQNFEIAKKLVDGGAAFESTEEPLLVSESESWLETMMHQESNSVVFEMFEQTMKDRDSFVSKRINDTLVGDELGVLFMDPSRRVSLDEKIKIIIMCRFDPLDYLKSWQLQLKQKTNPA